MLQHIDKVNSKNEEVSSRLRELQMQENEIRNRLDFMTTDNNNATMRLTQQCEHLEKENGTILHDISTIPVGSPRKTRQEELEELNEYDNVTTKTVNKYLKRVDGKVSSHNDEINEAFEKMQERLRGHFKIFANNVRDKFEKEVIQMGINQEFEKLSPIKRRDDFDEDYVETGEDSRLSGIHESEERIGNDDCLSPELKQMKTTLVRAYTNPLEEYQSSINTTAEFGKNARLQKDIKYMSLKHRMEKQERSASVEQKQKRENMKKRLNASKLRQSLGGTGISPNEMVKSARLWNAFDSTDPYPDKKFTTNVSSPSVPQTLTPNSKSAKVSLFKAQSTSVYAENNVRKKKDEIVKTLLFSNRNR